MQTYSVPGPLNGGRMQLWAKCKTAGTRAVKGSSSGFPKDTMEFDDKQMLPHPTWDPCIILCYSNPPYSSDFLGGGTGFPSIFRWKWRLQLLT